MKREVRTAIPGRLAHPVLRNLADGQEVFGSPCADDYAKRDMTAYYNRKGSGFRVLFWVWRTEKPLTPMQTLILDEPEPTPAHPFFRIVKGR